MQLKPCKPSKLAAQDAQLKHVADLINAGGAVVDNPVRDRLLRLKQMPSGGSEDERPVSRPLGRSPQKELDGAKRWQQITPGLLVPCQDFGLQAVGDSQGRGLS